MRASYASDVSLDALAAAIVFTNQPGPEKFRTIEGMMSPVVQSSEQDAVCLIAGAVSAPESLDSEQVATLQELDDDQNALFLSDSFRMYCFKVLPCAKRQAHEWTTCPWAHPGEKARRRDPRVYNYLAIPCPDTKEGKGCPRGDDCPNCHSLFEYWLHPSRYRTQLCRNNDGSHCKRQICFFAHSIEELRVPDHSHLNIPEEMKQQSSNTASSSADRTNAAAGGSPKGSSSPMCGSSSPKQGAPAASSCNVGSPKAAHGSSHKPKRSIASKLGTSKSLGSEAMTATPAGAVRKSLDLPPSPATPAAVSAAIASFTRHPSGTLGLSLEQQQQAVLVSPGAGEVLCRSASLGAGGPAAAAQQPSTAPGTHSAAAGTMMFTSGMIGDPEVPEPAHPPESLAMQQQQQQQQQQLMQLQKEQLEASMGAAAAVYEQNLAQLLTAQQQQQVAAAWANSRGYIGQSGYSAEYSSPPLSPSSSSLLSSVTPEDASSSSAVSAYTSLGSLSSGYAPAYGSMGGPNSMAWRLPRTVSGPPGNSPHAGYAAPSSFRYQSLDSATTTTAGAAACPMPGSAAADVAAVRAQMEMMCSPQAQAFAAAAAMGPTGYPPSSGLPMQSPKQLQQQAYIIQQQQQAAQQQVQQQQHQQQQMAASSEQLNLADVAELVDSVNRGELGECGSQVLTGVIGLLMQQLQQQQQLAA